MTSSHTQHHRTFINFRKAKRASFKDDIELKLKKQQRPNVYHAEKTSRKAINAAVGRHLPQGRIKTVFANFPSEAVKLSEKRDEIQRKHPGDPKLTQPNHETSKLVQGQKRKKWVEIVQTYRGKFSKLWSRVKGLSSGNAKTPVNRAR